MNLGKLLEEVYVSCGLLALRRAATGGSTTTVVDSAYANRKGDGYYSQGANGGHILIISQTTDRAAPEGQFGEISGFTLSTTTPTFTVPTMTAAAGAGDIYSVMKPAIQLQEMIGRINEGLRRITEQERVDTTLTTLANTLAYNLPTGVRKNNILKIEIGNDAYNYGWEDAPGYEITPSSGGTADILRFHFQPDYDSSTAANKTIKITYLASHPVLSVYSDYVEKSLSDDLVIKICAEAAFEMLMRKKTSSYTEKGKVLMWAEIQQRAAMARQEHPVRNQPANRKPRINLGEL